MKSSESTQQDGTVLGTALGALTLAEPCALSAHELLAASERRDLPQCETSVSATPCPWATIPPGASHSAEIEYAMGNLPLNAVFAWTPEDYVVSATMMTYFANFVKRGDPNGGGLPVWPVGKPDASGTVMRMRLDVQSAAEPEPRARYLFLQSLAR